MYTATAVPRRDPNHCAKWTIGIGTCVAVILAIVYVASAATAFSAASACVSDCNSCSDKRPVHGKCGTNCKLDDQFSSSSSNMCICSCDKEASLLGGSVVVVAISFYLFWPFAIAACIGCCCLCCNSGASTTVVSTNYAQMPSHQAPLAQNVVYPAAPAPPPRAAPPQPSSMEYKVFQDQASGKEYYEVQDGKGGSYTTWEKP